MAITKAMREEKKAELMKIFIDFLKEKGEDVLEIGSNVLAFPFCYANGEEDAARIKIEIPTGSRDGEPFDCYGEAESWELKKKQKAAAAEKKKKDKEAKIKRDEEYRRKQQENKEKRNAGQ